MKELSNVLNKLDLSKQGNHSLQNNVPPIVKSIVDSLFDQLAFVFPAWKYTWDSEEKIKGAKKEWVKAFFENGITTKEQIACGLRKARKKDGDFLPSCGTFVSWCNPSPEDLGYPTEQKALMLCVSYRANIKLGLKTHTRPLIMELCKTVDWFLMNAASTQAEHKKAEAHFKAEYMALINSGYQEPEESSVERLETSEVVVDRMSPEQLESRKNRGLNCMSGVKRRLAQIKRDNLSK